VEVDGYVQSRIGNGIVLSLALRVGDTAEKARRLASQIMKLKFWPEIAPKTVENFLKLAGEGFYDGTAIHRIVKGFMIQGGDPLSKEDHPQVGTGGPGYKINAEFNDRPHVRGVISMARSQHPDSAGSQFFICLAEANFLDGQYTAFGELIEGDDILGAIGDTPTVPSGSGENSKPERRVGVTRIRTEKEAADTGS
jgi:peptidyl-prolyl cis-trans isomerase B (cyclophilin B)